IMVTAAGPTLADGKYVFQISGPAESEGEFVTGVLVAQGGAITGGEQDVASDDGEGDEVTQFQQITGGSYTTTASGNSQINLQIGAYETETLSGTLKSNAEGFIGGIGGTPGSSTLELQTSTAAPSGGYAISLYADYAVSAPLWVGGVVNIDSPGGISGNGTVLDAIGGYAGSTDAPTLAPSTVSAPDAYGRVVFQLNPGASSPLPVLYLAGYMVDATHIWLSETSNPSESYPEVGIFGGMALGQGTATGSFTASSVAGTSYVFGAQGNDLQDALQLAGVLTLNAGGSVSGTLNWNDLSGKSAQPPLAFTGSYTVDPEGRVTLSNLTDGATFNYSLHLYLSGSGGGLLLSNDSDDLFSGEAFERQTGAFTASSFSGAYGLNASVFATASNGSSTWGNAVGPVVATASGGADTVAGYADTDDSPADFALTGSFVPAANGVFTGTLAGFGPLSAPTANPFTLYLVDGTQGVGIETDNAQLTLFRVGTQ
ncbi:MAG: hypothetical protein ACRD27_11470, partial [Terracidiphilus sp.]